jgi:hypothetical protein
MKDLESVLNTGQWVNFSDVVDQFLLTREEGGVRRLMMQRALEPMKDLLSAEQREDLRAALARRHLVKSGGNTLPIAVDRFLDLRQAQPVPAILFR